MNILNLLFVEPWPWWLGGIAIGLLVPLMYYFLNTALGVSTVFFLLFGTIGVALIRMLLMGGAS